MFSGEAVASPKSYDFESNVRLTQSYDFERLTIAHAEAALDEAEDCRHQQLLNAGRKWCRIRGLREFASEGRPSGPGSAEHAGCLQLVFVCRIIFMSQEVVGCL